MIISSTRNWVPREDMQAETRVCDWAHMKCNPTGFLVHARLLFFSPCTKRFALRMGDVLFWSLIGWSTLNSCSDCDGGGGDRPEADTMASTRVATCVCRSF